MHDDKLIDSALKEHARLENQDDEAFLQELEAITGGERPKKQKASGRKRYIPQIAVSMVACLGVFLVVWLSTRGTPTLDEENSFAAADGSELLRYKIDTRSRPQVKIGEPQPVFEPMEMAGNPPARTAEFQTNSGEAPTTLRMTGMAASSASISPAPLFESGVVTDDHFAEITETGFLSPATSPLSTFSIDVDTASYSFLRKTIESNAKVNPHSIRIEEMLNYFTYDYPSPTGEHPIAIHTEVASCPWAENHRLVKVGLQAKKVKASERKATNLVFLIDVSGSMSSPDKLPLLAESFEILLQELNENDRVSIVVYAGADAILMEPTAMHRDGREQAQRTLQNLRSGGGTNGSAGITTAYRLAHQAFRKEGVNRVILATDGDFNIGVTGSDNLINLVKKEADREVYLSILGFGRGNLNDAMMEKLTNAANGNYFYIDSLKEGQKVFQHQLTGTLETVAKDTKIQVEFNPGKVAQYRLIGYGNRRLKDRDFADDKVDAGDVGAGHQVTALYEIIPVGVPTIDKPLKYQTPQTEVPKNNSPEMLTVSLRYKKPTETISSLLTHPLIDSGRIWAESTQDFRFASSVALWGMFLSDSTFKGSATPALVKNLAQQGTGQDKFGQRIEFRELVRKWAANN